MEDNIAKPSKLESESDYFLREREEVTKSLMSHLPSPLYQMIGHSQDRNTRNTKYLRENGGQDTRNTKYLRENGAQGYKKYKLPERKWRTGYRNYLTENGGQDTRNTKYRIQEIQNTLERAEDMDTRNTKYLRKDG